MTKIILHGGYKGFWEDAGKDTAFFQKLIDGAKASDNKILISFLAQNDDLSDFPHMEELLQTFNKLNSSVKISIADRSNFKELLPQHKVLFLQGGDSLVQQKSLEAFSKEDILKDKFMLAGSSSGANLLCKYGFTGSYDQVIKGKGIVDIAVMPHASSWPVDDFLPKIREVTDSPIVLINEYEIVELDII